MPFFDGFAESRSTSATASSCGSAPAAAGPPVLLLHGHPRTHTTWHRVAPLLVAAGHTVVCPDLRGYGRSSKPPTTPDHAPYSKRAMAGDVVALMRSLGHDRFAVVGHDRGSYVALRTALDHPDAVTHLAALDCIPIVEHLERADARFATAWWHWFFFAQPEQARAGHHRRPGRLVRLAGAGQGRGDGGGEPRRPPRRDPRPATVHAMVEDYRAGLGVDRAAEEADRAAGRRVTCPTLVLWSARDDLEELHGDPRRDLGGLDDRPARRRADRQRPPHGRGGTGGAGRRAGPVPRDVIICRAPG